MSSTLMTSHPGQAHHHPVAVPELDPAGFASIVVLLVIAVILMTFVKDKQ